MRPDGPHSVLVPCHAVLQVVVKALSDCGVRDAIVYPGAKCIELLKVNAKAFDACECYCSCCQLHAAAMHDIGVATVLMC